MSPQPVSPGDLLSDIEELKNGRGDHLPQKALIK